MNDPVAIKNAKRILALHRVAELSFQRGEVECTCGVAMKLEEMPESVLLREQAVSDLFLDHRRIRGTLRRH